jgi:hypothetical protein
MKYIILALCGLLLLVASCSHIYYQEVQPKGGERLTEIPKELHGSWFDENDGWQLDATGMTNMDVNIDTITLVQDTLRKFNPLSDSLRIYRAQNLYVLHFRTKKPYWEIVVLQPYPNGDLAVYYLSDPEKVAKLKGLKLVSADFTYEEELRTVPTLEPEGIDSLNFKSALFSGQMTVKGMKKLLKTNGHSLFRQDGTVVVREKD